MTSTVFQNKWLRALAWGAAAIVLLVASSWVLVPPLLKSQLEKRASEALGRRVTVGPIDFKPWSLELEIKGIDIAHRAGQQATPEPGAKTSGEGPQLHVDRIYVDAANQSLVRMAPVLDALKIEGLALKVTHLGAGKYDFDDVLERLKQVPDPKSNTSEPMQFALYNLALTGASLDFTDHSPGQNAPITRPIIHHLRDLNLSLPFLSNLPSQREVRTEPRLAFTLNGSAFDSRAQTTPFAASHKSDAKLHVKALDLKPYLAYLPASLPVRMTSAVLDADLTLAFEQTSNAKVKLTGTVQASSVKLLEGGTRNPGSELLAFDALKVVLDDVRPLERIVKLSVLELVSPNLAVRRDKGGQLNLMQLGGAAPASQAQLMPSNAIKSISENQSHKGTSSISDVNNSVWSVAVAKMSVQGGAVHFSDDSTQPNARLAVNDLSVEVTGLALPFVQAVQFNGSAVMGTQVGAAADTMTGTGSARRSVARPDLQAAAALRFEGNATSKQGQLSAHLGDVPLALAAPYLAAVLEPRLAGRLSADLVVNWTPAELWVASPRFALAQLALLPQGSGAALASVKKLEISDARVDLAHQTVAIGKLLVEQPSTQVERSRDQHWMFEKWLKSAGKGDAQVFATPAGNPAQVAANQAIALATGQGGAAPTGTDAGMGTGTPARAAKPAPVPSKSGWQLSVGEARVDGGAFGFLDHAAGADAGPVALALSGVRLHVKNFVLGGKNPMALLASAQLKAPQGEPGQVDYQGSLALVPLTTQGRLTASQIPVHALEPYFGQALNVNVVRADLGFKGDVRFADSAAGPQVHASGDSVLEELQVKTLATSAVASEDLLSWRALSLRGLDVALAPGVATTVLVKETALTDFFARVLVHENGRINLQDLLKSSAPADASKTIATYAASTGTSGINTPAEAASAAKTPAVTVSANAAASTSVPVVSSTNASTSTSTSTSTASPTTPTGLEPVITIGPIGLVNGKVAFSDHFVKPNYSANLSELTGSLGGFSSVPTGPAGSTSPPPAVQMADLELRGRAEGTAALEILGKLNPLAKPLALDIKGKVRDLELAPLSTYAVKYAGYGIERGKLSVDVAYEVLPNGQLNASNNIILNQLKFGDKVEGAPNSLPVKLAVALLADRNGVIDINLPVSGSLNDPQFRLGPIIFKVIVNLIVKAIVSPFSLLASAFGGGGDELSQVGFLPGTAILAADAPERLDKVAKAMLDRPALKLTVVGSARLEEERDAYKQARFNALLLAEKRRLAVVGGAGTPVSANANANANAAAAVQVLDAERSMLLKEAYKRADLPKPRNLIGMAKDLPDADMQGLLLAHIAVTDDLMRDLALQRGVAVKDYLAGKQLPVERLFLGNAKAGSQDALAGVAADGKADAAALPQIEGKAGGAAPVAAKWSPRAELSLLMN